MGFSFNPFYFLVLVYYFIGSTVEFIFLTLTSVWFGVFWFFLGLILVGLIVLVGYRINRITKTDREKFEHLLSRVTSKDTETKEEIGWQKILAYLDSINQSDWKLAILEADTMLDKMVTGMGYRGDNLGEKLKSIEPSDFTTLDQAWEAHKVRNRIAHENDYEVSHKEARRVIALFEQVFREFGFI